MKQLLIIIQLLLSLNVIAQIDTTTNLSDKEKILYLSKFWSEAKYNFVYFDQANINWDSAYAVFIPKALATKSTWDYFLVLKQFAALLKDGHTDISEPYNLYNDMSRYKFSNIEWLNDHFYITNIDVNDKEKVPLGSEVLTVNDTPVVSYLKSNITPYISASTPQELWNNAASQMFYGTDTTQQWRLKLKTPDGKFITYNAYFHTYPRIWVRPFPQRKRTAFEKIDNIGYLQINNFADTGIIRDFKEILPQLRMCKGVILDIRNNGGGNSAIGAEILKYFTTEKTIIGSTWKTRENLGAFKAWGKFLEDRNIDSLADFDKTSLLVYQGDYWYQGDTMQFENDIQESKILTPLVVITGNSTASAAEDFLIMLSGLKNRAITVGQVTYGSTGQPLIFDLPSGGSARICAKKDTYPDGREFVGYGIKPDIVVERNIKDIIEGKDTELEVAINELRREIK